MKAPLFSEVSPLKKTRIKHKTPFSTFMQQEQLSINKSNKYYYSFRLSHPNSSKNLIVNIIKKILPGRSEATNLNAAVDTLFAVPGLVLMSYSEKKPMVCGSKLYLARF